MKCLFLCFFLLFVVNISQTKVLEKKMSRSLMKTDTWHPITKFAMRGQGYYSIKLWNQSKKKANQVVSVDLFVYTYENWQLQQNVFKCEEKQQYSNHKQKIELPLNGDQVSIGKLPLGTESNIQIWYFVLTSCGDSYSHILLQSNPITYELTILNGDGSHISEEENGIITMLVLILVPMFCFLSFHSIKMINFYTNQAALDYPLVILMFAVVMEFLALFSELLHLYFYSKDGKGNFMFDWANIVFANLSQFIISLLFLLMAAGWTVKTLSSKDEKAFTILGILASMLIMGMSITGKISTNDINSFHDYENWSGVLSLFINVVFYFLFGIQLIENYENSDIKLKKHYFRLGIFGSLYLLTFPLTIIAADVFLPPYLRHKATTYVIIIVQSVALVLYASILSYKEGEYYPIVYKNKVILPLNKMI